ncbi:MAG: nucleotidyltransferase domain-containing protein [Planctomycetaceae bacterium]|nr:MAG: nucleotidyltransferase domain-containing protein [Planctomycetaceae bacterium]
MIEQIVERFGREKIVLFGSHAYGQPSCDSDVDVLVVMPTKNESIDTQSLRLAGCQGCGEASNGVKLEKSYAPAISVTP